MKTGEKRDFTVLQILHSIVGLLSAIVLLFLTVTGLLLNHRDGLTLHEKYPASPSVLWLYGYQENDAGSKDYIVTPPSWEKVITAFHGGRFFNKPVRFFIDLAGAVIIFQAITGIIIAFTRARRNRYS